MRHLLAALKRLTVRYPGLRRGLSRMLGHFPWLDLRLRNAFIPRVPETWQPLVLDDLPESTAEIYHELKARMTR